jgi:hypothetical protein
MFFFSIEGYFKRLDRIVSVNMGLVPSNSVQASFADKTTVYKLGIG